MERDGVEMERDGGMEGDGGREMEGGRGEGRRGREEEGRGGYTSSCKQDPIFVLPFFGNHFTNKSGKASNIYLKKKNT
jgi:hypothetical protein